MRLQRLEKDDKAGKVPKELFNKYTVNSYSNGDYSQVAYATSSSHKTKSYDDPITCRAMRPQSSWRRMTRLEKCRRSSSTTTQ